MLAHVKHPVAMKEGANTPDQSLTVPGSSLIFPLTVCAGRHTVDFRESNFQFGDVLSGLVAYVVAEQPLKRRGTAEHQV
jgi:hypothetical protein